ncbi:isoprenylcysteine carboxylmethyltransferase family protein [Candidatus Borrarchaeum sp.]|uniref:methyltransferase family protein n=1 Tax=Candidatus Borrarchaeum sp. TaxID=2846742 RepID=UPI00257E6F87|nr:isoprenylcysteine carboxylmethyltransferase family protein [Candidatus Borrarchaeum sp.]
MYIWFFFCIIGVIAIIPLHFLSVEHLKLQEKYGKEKGIKRGEIYGLISGWFFFIFWMGLWFSPQSRFTVPILQNVSVIIPIINFSIPVFHLIICTPFLALGAWLGIKGVQETTLKVTETHRPEKIITGGVYSAVRHPQYFGGLLAHVGISFLLSAIYSLFFTPLMILLVYLISWKEEKELVREFGKEYEDYKKKVPMLLPKIRK